jgi:nucleoside-diphosphate-sugar epimerase
MARSVFIAGAAGAIGWPLCRLLVADGWQVTGTTRRRERAARLQSIGVTPAVVDVFDADALRDAVVAAAPEVVIHQLTDLPPALAPELMAAARTRNAHIREAGTANLVAAAIAAGARRLVAQSIAFAYAPGAPVPTPETAPLDAAFASVASLEQQILTAPMPGVVLRYGRLYGPGTGFETAGPAPLHVDAAAGAARCAGARGAGVYNIAEDDGTVDTRHGRAELGWDPAFRLAG